MASVEKGRTPPRRFAALHSRNFRLLWSGLFVSNAGTQMQSAGLYWLVLELTGSTVALGLVSLSFALPMMILPFLGGTIADRYNRLTILKITQTSAMVLALLLTALTLLDAIAYWQIIAINLALAVLLALDNPTRQALLPDLVPAEDLVSAASLNSAAFTGAALVGPALGGLLLVAVGAAGLFALNVVSYLAILGAFFAMRGVPQHRRETGLWWRNIAEGLQYIGADRLVLGLVCLSAALSFFGNVRAYLPLMPVLATERLAVGEIGYGLLLAAPGAGSLVGAFGLAYLGDFRARDRALSIGVALAGVTLLAFGLTLFFPAVLALFIINGACSTGAAALIATSLQLRTPPRLRGRVMSLYAITIIGIGSLGGLAAGAAAELIAPGVVVMIGGAVATVLGLLFTRRLREVRQLGR